MAKATPKSEQPANNDAAGNGTNDSTHEQGVVVVNQVAEDIDIDAVINRMANANKSMSLNAVGLKMNEGETKRMIFLEMGKVKGIKDNGEETMTEAAFFIDPTDKLTKFTSAAIVCNCCRNLIGLRQNVETFVEITFDGKQQHPNDRAKTLNKFTCKVVY